MVVLREEGNAIDIQRFKPPFYRVERGVRDIAVNLRD
jgi:hypothetical protein